MKSQKKSIVVSIFIAFSICITIVSVVFAFALNNPSQTPPADEPPIQEPGPSDPQSLPTLTVPSLITIELLDTSKTFTYEVSNLNNYVVSVAIESSQIATISNNIITPLSIGTTKIITTINCEPLVTKETTLKVIDCVQNIELLVTDSLGNTPEVYLTKTTYTLEFRQNIAITDIPELSTSNITNLTHIKTENSSCFFEFQFDAYGNASIAHNGKYVNVSKNYFIYNNPTNFNVNFSNVTANNNQIDLFLFNNQFINTANNEGFFSGTNFEIQKQANVYDEIILLQNYNQSIIRVIGETITALDEGTTQISFYSNISKVTKTYNVYVAKINLSSILVNGINSSSQNSVTVELSDEEEYAVNFTPYPIYAICELSLDYQKEQIIYSNNKISLQNGINSAIVYIKNYNNVIYTIKITRKSAIAHRLEITNKTCEASVNNLKLTVTLSNISEILLKCTAYNTNTGENLSVQSFSVKINDTEICQLSDIDVSSGNIRLGFMKAGTTTLIITDNANNIQIELSVVVN